MPSEKPKGCLFRPSKEVMRILIKAIAAYGNRFNNEELFIRFAF
jgi:hypothetical protein